MPPFRKVQLCAVLIISLTGCKSSPVAYHRGENARQGPEVATAATATAASKPAAAPAMPPTTAMVAYREPLPQPDGTPGDEMPLGGAQIPAELSLPELVAEVQARNPSLQAMAAAWRAAAARYPQVIALDDPMFMAMAAPASFDSDVVNPGYTLQAAQKLPWFGKRAVRGDQAVAETRAALGDLRESSIKLAELTELAYYDHYLVTRQLELNRQNNAIIHDFRDNAQAKYEAKQVTAQDLLQADVELGENQRRRLELEQRRQVAAARINTLLRQPPFAPLPPPPRHLNVTGEEVDVDVLQAVAASQRPDLAALGARVQSERAAVVLAYKQHYPDVEVFGRYDPFWQEADLQASAGVNLNVPIYHGRLNAAVREAELRLNQRRAEYEQLRLDVQYEVAVAYSQVQQSRQTAALYAERLVPIAEQNIAAVRANYDAGVASFLELAAADRQYILLREQEEESLVAYHRSRTELARAVGGSLPIAEPAEAVPPPRNP